MSSVYVGKNLRKFESVPQFVGYTRVVLQVSDDIEYSAGTDTGRTLTLVNPWGTQQLAEAILAQVKGFAYQPYSAFGAIVDAAAELGDAVSVNGIYSGVYELVRRYGGVQLADLSAPSDEEIDHEYPYKSPQDRTVNRQLREVRASLLIQADRIAAEVSERKNAYETLSSALTVQASKIDAKVSKSGGSPSSFGWALDEKSWTLRSNNTVVLAATKDGVEITGKITATSGKIGGFDITKDSLSHNNHTWGGTNTSGIYIGPNGIQLGKNFKVDMQGKLTATGGTFDGTIKCQSLIVDGQTISPSSVRSGISGGNSYTSSGWGNYSASTVAGNAVNGNMALRVLEGTQYMATINLRSGTFQMNGYNVYLGTIMVNGTSLKVLRWA